MKKLALVFAIVLVTISGHAQKTADIGIWGGSSTVWGDMDDNSAFQTFNLNFGAYFRYNFNARVALRAMFLTGKMAREGEVEESPWNFDKSAQDLTLQVEINYLKYILGKKKLRFSPYVTAGIGVAYFSYTFRPEEILAFNADYPELQFNGNGELIVQDPPQEESEIIPTIPFGFGFKYTIGERFGLGVEYQMRKYTSDRLDDLDDPLAFERNGEVVSYNQGSHNNDWVGYLGVHITYKIYIGKKACPAYESKQ